MAARNISMDKVKRGAGLVYSYKMGQMVSLMIHLGDRLDLYKSMAALDRFFTTEELATHTGYKVRWLREWLRGMAAAKILEYEEGTEETERFQLSVEMAEVLANEETSLSFSAGAFTGMQIPALSDGLVEAFKTGVGMSYRANSLVMGKNSALGTKRMLGAWTKIALVPQVIAAMRGGTLGETLRKPGAKILDMGCGAGIAVNCVAAAFPCAVVHGVDPDGVALEVARADAAAAGLGNAEFVEAKGEDLSSEGVYDFAMCLDIVHDCPFPDRILLALRRALKPGGTLLIKDIKSTGSFKENLQKNPMLAMLYGFSVSVCMSSALSEPGGMGLGTLGFNPPVAKRMCNEAGFLNFTTHDFKDPANLYYECIAPGGDSSALLQAQPTVANVDLSSMPAPAFCRCHGGGFSAQCKL